MTGPAHVLSPTGGWMDFEAFDPGAVEAVKALLDANICSNACAEGGSFPSTTESGPGDASTSRGPDTTCVEVMP